MPVKNFTAQWIERAKPPLQGRIDYFDERLTGLGLRLSQTGRNVWFVMYRVKGDPTKRRLTLDPYPAMSLADARDAARHVLVEASAGRDPGQEKQEQQRAATFAALAAEYLEKYAKRKKRSWQEDARVIKQDLLPVWGRRKVHDVRRQDVIDLLDAIVDRGAPIQANRTLALVRKLFNWAIGRGLVENNPCLMIEAPAKENQRERVLSEDEMRAIWHAFEDMGPAIGSMFKLRLLTGQRGGEVQTMRWQDLDLDAASWTIPPERSKNALSHFVPLSKPALTILRGLKPLTGNQEWVFPSPTRSGQHIANVQKAADRVRKAAGIEGFVLHDLRRTAASYMTSMGISRLVVSKILNHVEQGVTRVYDRHSYDKEKRQALDAWASKLRSIVGRRLAYVAAPKQRSTRLVLGR